jgi:glycosyltransferase involved in cell wall biosynthesis
LRFSHAYKDGGGVEEHLKNLDRTLLARNKLKIIRIYLEKENKRGKTITEKIGQGDLVKIPLAVSGFAPQTQIHKQNKWESTLTVFREIFRESVIYNTFLYRVFFREYLRKYYPQQHGIEANNAGEEARKIFQEHIVDLLVMHDIGGIDSAEIIQEAKKHKIPYIYINHFSNVSFNNISVREQLNDAVAIAGVTDVALPKWLKGRFHNVSNGIDMDIYNPALARPIGLETNIPLIILPARITQVKGQADLLKACVQLRKEGLRTKIVFAGRKDSAEYEEQLKEFARKNGMIDDILFLGQLNAEELRDWYGASAIMAFPTYHPEGLPRIMVEAQAMKVPPVAYIIGGTPEALQDGKTGFLVHEGDVNTFTQRLRELLTDKKKREAMGEAGRNFVEEKFSLGAQAERHEKLYLRALKA